MHVAIGDRGIDSFSDGELLTWLNEREGYSLRTATANLWLAVLRAFDEVGPPMTVRQVFYALVSRGALAKTEASYKRVCYHLLQMRRNEVIPYSFVSDNTRWMRKPTTYDSLEACLRTTREAYRRTLWQQQGVYVEVWCEKDALAGVLYEITEEWDVPLMVTRGFPSESFVFEAAENMKERGQPAAIYYFGDYDPSGCSISQTTEAKLRDFGAEFIFEQVAVLPWQIEAWELPTRPTKRSDSRSKTWEGESVELDAIPVTTLRSLVSACIERHIDERTLERTRRIETAERETLELLVNNLGLGRNWSGGSKDGGN